MKIAVLQMKATPGDPGDNLQHIADAATDAAARGAQCLVVPELAVPGYGAGADFARLAEPADGPQVRRLQAIAAASGLTVVAGYAEAAGGAVYNAAVAVNGDGPLCRYRKMHLYGDYERDHFRAGVGLAPLFDLGGLKAGLLICYDVEFPETVRHLAAQGADLVLVPTALPSGPLETFIATRIVPARAFENQVFVAYADHAGSDGHFDYAGLSCVIAPDGTDLARADGETETLLIADVDPAAYDEARRANPYLADRRLDFPPL